MLKEKEFRKIVNLYEDPYCIQGTKYPISITDTSKIVKLVKKQQNIVRNYPDSIRKPLTIHAKSLAVKGIKEICSLPMHEALLVYNVITNYLK